MLLPGENLLLLLSCVCFIFMLDEMGLTAPEPYWGAKRAEPQRGVKDMFARPTIPSIFKLYLVCVAFRRCICWCV